MEALNSKYADILLRSRMMSIPLIRCDDQVLKKITKQENIDENGHNNDDSILQIDKTRTIEKEVNKTNINIKSEEDIIDAFTFDGSVLNEDNSLEITDGLNLRNNLRCTANCRTNPRSDQVFDTVIKQEFIDEIDYNNDHKLLEIGKTRTIEKEVNKTNINIKSEEDIIDAFTFDGSVLNEDNSLEITDGLNLRNNLRCTANCRTNPRSDQVFDTVIKQEFIDEIDYNNDHKLLEIGKTRTIEKEVNKTNINIKSEEDIIDAFTFDGSVLNEDNSLEITDGLNLRNNLRCTANCRTNPRSDQVFDTVIKQEFIDEIDYNNDHKLLEIGTVCQAEEEVKTIDTEIKVEKDIIEICEFKGTVLNNSHSSKLISSSGNKPNLHDTHQKCNICNLSFNSKKILTSHMKIHTIKNKDTFVCGICNKSYYMKSYLTKHLLLHIGETPFICTVCNKTFSDKKKLDIHKRTHTEKKTYKCDICDKTLTTSKSLVCHTRIHTGEKPFKCDFCEKAFATKPSLKIHTRTHTGEKPYKCDICDRRFSEAGSVISHKRTHTGKKPYKCDICDKRFSHAPSLKDHSWRHTNKKPFKCKVCSFEFTKKSSMKVHMRKHTGEKPFECEICDRRFSQRNHFIYHKITHTDEKPYECDICSKTFRVKCSLKTHIITTHTKEYKFKCDICDKEFYLGTLLKRHKRLHTEEKPYKCNVCNKAFPLAAYLKSHSRTHTNKKAS